MSFTFSTKASNYDVKCNLSYLDDSTYENRVVNDITPTFYINEDLIGEDYGGFKFYFIYKTIKEELNSVIKYNFTIDNINYNGEIYAPKTIIKERIENKINELMSSINNNTYNLSRINNNIIEDDKIIIDYKFEPIAIKRNDYILLNDGIYYGEVIEYNTLYKTYVHDLDINYYFMSTEQIVKPTDEDDRIRFDGLIQNNIVNEYISQMDVRSYYMYDLKDSDSNEFTIDINGEGFSDDKFLVNIERCDLNYGYKLVNKSSAGDNNIGCYYDYINAHHNKGDYYNYAKVETYHFMGSVYKARYKQHQFNLDMTRTFEMFNDHFFYNLGLLFKVNFNFNI